MDQEVAKTLGELELKLQELERELTTIGHHGKPADSSGAFADPPEAQGGTFQARDESFQAPDMALQADGESFQAPDRTPQADGESFQAPDRTPQADSESFQAPDRTPQADSESFQAPVKPSHESSGWPPTPGKLIDEAVERESADDGARAAERLAEDGDGFGGPPVFGGEEVPSQAGATTERDWTVEVKETAYGEIPTPPSPSPGPPQGPPIPPPAPIPQPPPSTPPGPPPPETPPGPPPRETPPGHGPQPIDRMELVRFKQKLERTMEDLIDECSKLLLPKPPA